ncbi:hypothetical protein RRG08_007641 [Elysia crispata]|uniref:Uncharacterized protein n=1 Tax=Elysia crispata TaxID=231223 RepID=A0AAE0Y3R5_9GAST|nr:hypothetical protein RRG08_007641 [Elysia crispata]
MPQDGSEHNSTVKCLHSTIEAGGDSTAHTGREHGEMTRNQRAKKETVIIAHTDTQTHAPTGIREGVYYSVLTESSTILNPHVPVHTQVPKLLYWNYLSIENKEGTKSRDAGPPQLGQGGRVILPATSTQRDKTEDWEDKLIKPKRPVTSFLWDSPNVFGNLGKLVAT